MPQRVRLGEVPADKRRYKLHLMLDHQGCLPCWALVTDGKTHEVNPAKGLNFQAGTIVAMDRGYNDYSLFADWCRRGVYFVTRLKSNAQFRVVRKRELPKTGNVLADEEIVFTGYQASRVCPNVLRRVVIWDDENDREIVLLTNHLEFGATTIGRIYKDRWQIELFFKALKQNLKVKTFVGTSENAVKIQIWTALITANNVGHYSGCHNTSPSIINVTSALVLYVIHRTE